jgi:hypothetical protein
MNWVTSIKHREITFREIYLSRSLKEKILRFKFLVKVFLNIQCFWKVTPHFWASRSWRFEDAFLDPTLMHPGPTHYHPCRVASHVDHPLAASAIVIYLTFSIVTVLWATWLCIWRHHSSSKWRDLLAQQASCIPEDLSLLGWESM